MIECKFIFRFKGGGASDSLNQSYKVHSVPCIGEKIAFMDKNGDFEISEVKEVIHYINPTNNTHEITVFYGST